MAPRDGPGRRRIELRVWGDEKAIPNAPHLLDVEVAQVLRRLVRSRVMPADLAHTIIGDLRYLDLMRHAHVDLLDRAFELRDNLTAYDGIYVALAEALGATLVTTDGKLAKAPGTTRARLVVKQ